ncbi:hypothetical protein [Fulvimarina manganoxydans]|nr:hypothetical protein [Fulvimarina manganoxydans]
MVALREGGALETEASGDEGLAPRQKTEAEREQIKLRATYLSGIAIGVFLVGGLSLPSSILISGKQNFWIAFAIAIVCVGASPVIHWAARRSLKDLDR